MRCKGGSEFDFVVKVNAEGTAFLYCGYMGGSGVENDMYRGGEWGNAYVTGCTGLQRERFCVTVGSALTYDGSTGRCLSGEGQRSRHPLVYCGYIGGSGVDHGYSIAVDSLRNAYVTGDTVSTYATFPVTVGRELTNRSTFRGIRVKVSGQTQVSGVRCQVPGT